MEAFEPLRLTRLPSGKHRRYDPQWPLIEPLRLARGVGVDKCARNTSAARGDYSRDLGIQVVLRESRRVFAPTANPRDCRSWPRRWT